MSLRTEPLAEVPDETAGRPRFPGDNVSIAPRDSLGTVFTDGDFAPSTPRGRPAEALASGPRHVFQFIEDLSDRTGRRCRP
ncbi:MAG: hypothetical protein U0840_04115 [Gemmataceae bacterium]